MGDFWEQLVSEATLWDGIRKLGKTMRLKFIKFCASNASYYFICDPFADPLLVTKAPDLLLGISYYVRSSILRTKYKTYFFHARPFNPYPTAFPYGNGMVLHFYQQQESSTTKTVHKVINKRLKAYV